MQLLGWLWQLPIVPPARVQSAIGNRPFRHRRGTFRQKSILS